MLGAVVAIPDNYLTRAFEVQVYVLNSSQCALLVNDLRFRASS